MRKQPILACAIALVTLVSVAADMQVRDPESGVRAEREVDNAPPVLDEWIAGIHMGGRYGSNWDLSDEVPADYLSFLERVNANWVGISVMLALDDSMDNDLKPFGPNEYRGAGTFQDDVLRELIRGFREDGLHVYLTLALSNGTNPGKGDLVERWQLGDPEAARIFDSISEENWPWDPQHPDHEAFVATFFYSYTRLAVHYATIAEEEGVELFSLGTETDRLFRAAPTTARWSTGFGAQLREMTDSVRDVYSGLLTYAKSYCCDFDLDPAWEREQAMDLLWSYLDLDVIGLSTYLHLKGDEESVVPDVENLRAQWKSVFDGGLTFFAALFPEKPIVLVEFGYVNSPGASLDPDKGEGEFRERMDSNHNGIDDGDEEQAAILDAFFLTVSAYSDVVDGVFLHGNMASSDSQWNESFAKRRGFAIRGLPSESVVSEAFLRLRSSQ